MATLNAGTAAKTATPPPIVTAVPAKAPAKTSPEQTSVKMEDGRTVVFVGKRKIQKEAYEKDGHIHARFDFVNGKTVHFKMPKDTVHRFAMHGALQKIGDEAAGEKDVDDAFEAIEAIAKRLEEGKWEGREASATGGFSGASVVIRALCEVTGKTQDAIKAFLDKKLESTPGLTRQALYASFRHPNAKTAIVIARLEAEKAAKSSSVSAEDLLAEMKG